MADERVTFVKSLLDQGINNPEDIHRQLISHGYSGSGHMAIITAAQGQTAAPSSVPTPTEPMSSQAIPTSIPPSSGQVPVSTVATSAIPAVEPVTSNGPIPVSPVSLPETPEVATVETTTQPALPKYQIDPNTGKPLLIGYGALISQAISGSARSFKLLGGFVVAGLLSLVLMGALFAVTGGLMFINPLLAGGALLVLYLLLLILVSIAGFAYVRALLKRHERVGYWRNFGWGIKHFWQLGLLVFFVQLAVVGGMILIIIPGIIIAFYLTFAFHSFAEEELSVVKSLLRSTHLVGGRWWSVVGRMFVLGVGATLVMIIPLVVFTFLVASDSGLEGFITQMLAILMFFTGIMVFHVVAYGIVLIYESARDTKPVTDFVPGSYGLAKYIYIGFFIIGLGLIGFQLYGTYQTFVQAKAFFEAVNTPGTFDERALQDRLPSRNFELQTEEQLNVDSNTSNVNSNFPPSS